MRISSAKEVTAAKAKISAARMFQLCFFLNCAMKMMKMEGSSPIF
jgi:hypothetical protein